MVSAAYALNYTGYIEPFDNTSRVQALSSLIHNSSLGSIGFNLSASGGGLILENLVSDGYTDVEEGQGSNAEPDNTGYLRYITDHEVRGFTVPLDKWGYIYKDYGAGYFDDFTATGAIKFNGYSSTGQYFPFSWGDSLADWDPQTNCLGIRMRHLNTPNVYAITLWAKNGASSWSDTYQQPSLSNAYYWLTMVKNGASVYLEIYSDAAKTSLVDNLTITLGSSYSYRYAFYGQTIDLGLTSRWLEGRAYNLSFRSGGLSDGVFYSKNLLDGVSSEAAALQYEALIDSGNEITLEVSANNSTWVQLQEATLYNGTGAVSLLGLGYSDLYVRCNFSRPVGSGACDLLMLNPIWEGGAAAAAGRDWILLMVIPVALLLGLAANHLSKRGEV